MGDKCLNFRVDCVHIGLRPGECVQIADVPGLVSAQNLVFGAMGKCVDAQGCERMAVLAESKRQEIRRLLVALEQQVPDGRHSVKSAGLPSYATEHEASAPLPCCDNTSEAK